ncbi:MAG: NAD(P)-dependent oxidoreductase [Dehalococcoidia bacterium]|nr:NAD(P)-dependent oxidoreductase [Dehalococcoidia bacterium]
MSEGARVESERPKVDRKLRFHIPAQTIFKQDAAERVCNWNEVTLGFADDGAARTEAERCIQCPAAPCIKACPVQNDIPGALWELEQGNYLDAANIFRLTSSMPEVCGRICPQERLCEGSCVVGNQKRVPPTPPVRIGRLETFVADYQRDNGGPPKPALPEPSGRSAAVIGSGPAGLTVAEDMAKAGHRVIVYEAWPKPGGILLYGIPNFKLDKSVAEAKIAYLEELGVEFVCNTRFGVDISLAALQEEHDAVFLGHGASIGASAGLQGEDLAGIYAATDFLVRGNLHGDELPDDKREPVTLGANTVVIGGGDTSMDCVRTAIRLTTQAGGNGKVSCVYRRTEAEMPGRAEERNHALQEGVDFLFLEAPSRFVGDPAGYVTAVEFVRMELGEPDASGRRRPVTIAGSEHLVPADTVVMALGYWGDEPLAAGLGLNHKYGLLAVDSETGATNLPGVFAGGDNVRGADLVVTAIAEAKRAARGMLEYLAAEVAK